MAAATYSDVKGSTWAARAASPEVTASLTWSAGDLIIVAGVTEDSSVTISTPTATGLTFTLVTSYTAGGCSVYIWKATAASGGSGAISAAHTAGSFACGLQAYAITGSGGVGVSGAGRAASGVLTRSLARGGANSGVVAVLGEFNATNDTAVTPAPTTNGTVDQAAFTSGAATFYAVHWGDQGAAGTTSYGIGSFTGTADMSIAVVEILEGAGGTTQVSATRAINYAVQAQVVATRRVNYGVLAQVAATRRVNYKVLAQVAATRRLVYAVAAAVIATRAVRYSVTANVAGTRRVNYSVAAGTTQVAATRRVVYAVSAQISATRRLRYDVLASVAGTRRVVYNVAAPVAATRRVVYGVNANVTGARRVSYFVGDAPASSGSVLALVGVGR